MSPSQSRADGADAFIAKAESGDNAWAAPARTTRRLAAKDEAVFQKLKDGRKTLADFDKATNGLGGKLDDTKAKYANMQVPRVELASNARAPRTAITWGWMDGTPGKLTIQYGENQIAERDVEWANTEYESKVKVVVLEKKSHMCDAECIVQWLGTVARELFRSRRRELGVGMEAKGLLTLDAGPHHIKWKDGFGERRDEILQAMNVILKILKPGSSAHGQPMDQIHNLLRHYAWKYEKLRTGNYDNVFIRVPPGETPRHESGGLVGLSNRDGILADLWGWEHIPKHMWLYAWYLCGYLSRSRMEEIAVMKCGMDTQEMKVAWRHAKKLLDDCREDLVDLSVAPGKHSVDLTPFKAELRNVFQVGDLGIGQGWRVTA